MNWRVVCIVVLGGLIMVGIVVVAVTCAVAFDQITSSSKEMVSGSIAGGTLSLGALALVFLGYSLVQRQEKFGTKVAHVHSRVAFTMFLLIVLSVFASMTSVGYLLFPSSGSQDTYSWLFDLSLGLVFVIGETLVAATTYVVAEEVAR
jgi:hypothetical protein